MSETKYWTYYGFGREVAQLYVEICKCIAESEIESLKDFTEAKSPEFTLSQRQANDPSTVNLGYKTDTFRRDNEKGTEESIPNSEERQQELTDKWLMTKEEIENRIDLLELENKMLKAENKYFKHLLEKSLSIPNVLPYNSEQFKVQSGGTGEVPDWMKNFHPSTCYKGKVNQHLTSDFQSNDPDITTMEEYVNFLNPNFILSER